MAVEPPNLIFASFIQENYGLEVSFIQWMKLGLPTSLVLLIISWLYITKVAFTFNTELKLSKEKEISHQLTQLGPMRIEEKLVLFIFSITV